MRALSARLAAAEPADRLLAVAVLILGGAGVVCRVSGALTAPLWDDEARQALALGGALSLDELARWPLNLRPILYLLLSKLAMSLYDAEWTLRLPSLLGSLAALPLTFAVARRLWTSRLAIGFAFGAVALSPWLIDFAKEYKPYALEHFFVTWLAYLALRTLAEERRWLAIGLAVSAALAPLLGFACVFAVPWILLGVAVEARRRQQHRVLAWVVGGGLAAAVLFGAQYVLFQRHASQQSFQYWNAHFYDVGFRFSDLARHGLELVGELPASPVTWASWSPGTAIVVAVNAGLFVLGVGALVARRRWGVLLVLTGALVAPLAASFAGRWPFGLVRVNLYLASVVVVAWASALDFARAVPRLRGAAALVVGGLAALQAPAEPQLLLEKQIPAAHMRPVLNRTDMPALVDEILAAESGAPAAPCVHVSAEARAAFTYYTRQRDGLPPAVARLELGRELDDNTRYTMLEVSAALRGPRSTCWLVRSYRYDEQLAARRALREGEFRVLAEVTAPGLVGTKIERLHAPITPRSDGELGLHASNAVLHGRRLWYYGKPRIGGAQGVDPRWAAEAVGNWSDPQDWVSWTIVLPRTAELEVIVRQAAVAPAGSEYEVTAGDHRLRARVAPTPSWREHAEVAIGALVLPAGQHQVSVRVRTLQGERAMNLRGLLLRPRAGAVAGAAGAAQRL